MALPAVAGNTIFASDLYQLCQPSGGQEKGKYWLAGSSHASSDEFSEYMVSLSRNATPVSVSIDTADGGPTNVGSPTTTNLTANGFRVHCFSNTSSIVGIIAGGNYTINY